MRRDFSPDGAGGALQSLARFTLDASSQAGVKRGGAKLDCAGGMGVLPGSRQAVARRRFGDFQVSMGSERDLRADLPAIVRAFDAAADTYDALSQAQWHIAQNLVAQARGDAPRTILDLGCGTGHLTEAALRRWPQAKIVALDRAPAMLEALERKSPGVRTILGDAAQPGTLGEFDLIFSSMVLHWLPEPRLALTRWRRLLAPGGQLHVAVPVEGSLGEWRAACRRIGVADGLWRFPEPDFAADLTVASCMGAQPTTYADARGFLKSLKHTGAQSAREDHRPLAPHILRRLLAAQQGPFTATFRIQYLELASVAPAP
jgi:malonyl-CoA O-methyltransferase